MTSSKLRVAVLGAGAWAEHAHIPGWLRDPRCELVAICDVRAELARDFAQKFGVAESTDDWQALVGRPDIDVIDVVTPSATHFELSMAGLEAGKHVLCEKPLAPSVADAEAMVAAAERAGTVAACGFSYRRSPAISAIGEQIAAGTLGELLQFNARYWCDYGADPQAPTSWRYTGAPGSGALADLGSHLIDLAEQLCGPIATIQGATLPTLIKDRPVPLGVALGHAGGVELSDRREPVTNDDVATFVADFTGGAVGTFSISRVARGHGNDLMFEVFGTEAAARMDLSRNSEFGFHDDGPSPVTNGWRRVVVGPEHPYIGPAQAMPFPGLGHGMQEYFTYQARAFLDAVAGLERLPAPATFADGLRSLVVEQAIVASAREGRSVPVAP